MPWSERSEDHGKPFTTIRPQRGPPTRVPWFQAQRPPRRSPSRSSAPRRGKHREAQRRGPLGKPFSYRNLVMHLPFFPRYALFCFARPPPLDTLTVRQLSLHRKARNDAFVFIETDMLLGSRALFDSRVTRCADRWSATIRFRFCVGLCVRQHNNGPSTRTQQL